MAEKRINPFTLEEEDVPEPLLAPSPSDQRILAAAPHTDPLPVLVARVMNGAGKGDSGVDVSTHVGPSLQGPDPLPGETPIANETLVVNDATPVVLNDDVQTQHEDVPSANEELVKAEHGITPATFGEYGGQAVDDNGVAVETEVAADTEVAEPEPKKTHKHKAKA